MKRVLGTTILLVMAGIASICLASTAAAQGTGPGGRFYTKAEVEAVIKRVEERSDSFRKVVDKSLDKSAINGTNREDNINEQVKELENAIDKLRHDFDRANTWQETREQVQRVLSEADEVNAIVRRGRWRRGGVVRSEWALVRNDLNRLAGVYNLPLLVA
ncbi:MAG TPA: hypothetical protein VLL54_03355 [Pyrinomonadaceae bacterium]|nr:hypothetical protein [Pyrinomonadaceae bacterium]